MNSQKLRHTIMAAKIAGAVWYRPYVIGYFIGKKVRQHKK